MEKHYKALETLKRAEGYEVVGALVGEGRVKSILVKRRLEFSEEELHLIQSTFADEIRLKRHPLKSSAEACLAEHRELFHGRSYKDIYNRVQNEWRNK